MRTWDRVQNGNGVKARYLFTTTCSDGIARVALLPESVEVLAVSLDEFASGWKYASADTTSVMSATASVATPTTSDMRDLLSEACAILQDSSENARMSSSASSCSSTRIASSMGVISGGSKKEGGKSSSYVVDTIGLVLMSLSAIVLSFICGTLVGRF